MNSSVFDSAYQNSFVESLAAASNNTFNSNEILITNISDYFVVNRKLTTGTQSIKIAFIISIIIEKLGIEESNAFSMLTSILIETVTSNSLNEEMNTRLQTLKGNQYTPISVLRILTDANSSGVVILRTAAPTLSPESKHEMNNDSLLLSGWNLTIVIVIPFLVLVIFLVIIIGVRKQNNKFQKVAVQYHESGGFEERKEAEPANEILIKPKSVPKTKTPPSLPIEQVYVKKIVVDAVNAAEPPEYDDPGLENQSPQKPQTPVNNIQPTPHSEHVFPFDDLQSHPPHRLILPPLDNAWTNQHLHHSHSIDLEGGAGSPLSSPKKATPARERYGKYGPQIHNDPAAESVDELLRLQAELNEINSNK